MYVLGVLSMYYETLTVDTTNLYFPNMGLPSVVHLLCPTAYQLASWLEGQSCWEILC